MARWLIDHGANVNARAIVDEGGFGGTTPLFNCIVSYNAGKRDEPLGRLLLDRSADPNTHASIRKRLPGARDKSVHESERDPARMGPRVSRSELCLAGGDATHRWTRRNGMNWYRETKPRSRHF